MALAALLAVAAAWAVGSAQAQSGCDPSGDVGALGSNQTVQRFGLLDSSSCSSNGYFYDFYTFELAGDGQVTISVSADDFNEEAGIGTVGGAAFARQDSYSASSESLTRPLPAGRYSAIAESNNQNRGGGYVLTISTGELAAPPPGTGTATQSPTSGQQTPPSGGQGMSSQADDGGAETVSGQVIARVLPLPDNDRRGRYRIEFGFLSAEVLASGTDRSAVVEANEHLLPPQRFLNENSLLARSRANDRRWLRSSPVDVLPLEDDDAGLSGEPLLTGRIIARWSPTRGGTFRVEFGFLPDWAFEAAGDDTQRAAELYAELLPESRYLTQSTINRELRRDQPRWLASSEVGFVGTGEGKPICVGPVTITPAGVPITLARGERITDEAIATIYGQLAETFTPVVVNGLPPGLTYDIDESRADGCEYQVTVSGTIPPQTPARTYSVSVTAEGAVGDPTTRTVLIDPGTTTLSIGEWGGYNPATTSIGGSVGIVQPRVVSPFPAPPGVVWSFETRTTDVCSVNSRTGALTLIGAGACQVTVTASAPGYGSAMASAQVTVDPTTPPTPIWSGYDPSTIEFSDAAPTILRPRAMVNGREVYPEWRYSVAAGSSEVCRVNEATGALTIMGVGECRINLTNLPRPPEYGVGTASALVQVRIGTGVLQWAGYSPASVRLGDTAPMLLPPTAASRLVQFSYQSITPSVCGADQTTGRLTLITEGTCSVTLSASGDPNYQLAPVTRTVVVTPRVEAPRIDSISCSPSEPRVGGAVTCMARLSGGQLDGWDWSDSGGGGDPSASSERYSTTFSQAGRQTISLAVRNAAGDDRRSATVTVTEEPNRAPQCSLAPDASVTSEVGDASSVDRDFLNQVCKDPDGDTLTFMVTSSSPSVVSVSPQSGRPNSFWLRHASTGAATITITATDPDGLSGSASYTDNVVIDIDNKPPICDPMPDLNVDVHDDPEINLSRYCSDPEGRRVRFAARSSDSAVVRVGEAGLNRGNLGLLVERGGTATITVTATDPLDASTDVDFDVRVRGAFACSNLDDLFTNNYGSGRTYDLQCSGSAIYSATSSDTSVARVSVSSSGRVTVTIYGVGVALIDVAARASDGRTWRQNNIEVVVNRATYPSSGYARCAPDTEKVYWFDTSTGMKHHLNMSWEDAQEAIPGWSDAMIGDLSAGQCRIWITGRALTRSDYS